MDFDTTFLSERLRTALPFPRKQTSGGLGINCPVCVSRGHARPDTRQRCHVRMDGDGSLSIFCFNCGFKTRWRPGSYMSKGLKGFLTNLSMDPNEVQELSFKAWRLAKQIEPENKHLIRPVFKPDYEEASLPPNSLPMMTLLEHGCDEPDFLEACEYLIGRDESLMSKMTFYWSNSKIHGMNRRIIIPYIWDDKIVGWTGRSFDKNAKLRYYTNTPPHFLFNHQSLVVPNRKYVIVVEGIFDALALDCVATQGSKLSNEQYDWIMSSGRTPIVLPDRDKGGQNLIDLALSKNWAISIPDWDDGVKDADAAVKRYGKLFTLKSVIESATTNKIKINLKRKRFAE